MSELHDLDATALAALIAAGEVSPAEAVQSSIDACARINPVLNAVFCERFERAQADAEACLLGSAPLAGVPTLIKDLGTPEAGEPMYFGNRLLRNVDLRAPSDCYAVDKMKTAGLISIGRTTVPEFASGNCPGACENEAFGDTRNPWDPSRTPMGSSGGSAAAVAAGIVPIAHANDGGGSTRIPASANGLVGMKASRGRISWGPGLGESWEGAATQGMVARSVRDAALGLDVLAGYMPGDPYGCPVPAGSFRDELAVPAGSLRIGVLKHNALGPLDPECVAAVERVAATLAEMGHQVEESHPDCFFDEASFDAYFRVMAVGIASAVENIGRLLGRPLTEADVERGTWVDALNGIGVSAVEYMGHVAQINTFTRAMAAWWVGDDGFDLLLSPTVTTPPPELGVLVRDPEDRRSRFFDTFVFTPQFNLSGQPAISLPLATSTTGLPIGIHLGARYGDEGTLLRVASALEEALPWQHRRPAVHASSVGS